jgi:signal transduction histidine kinase
LDTALTEQMREPLLKVALEALSNVSRHAQETGVQIVASVSDGRFTLAVDDDGIGMTSPGAHSGLENAGARAGALGGELEIGDSPLGGVRLRWSVPLSR